MADNVLTDAEAAPLLEAVRRSSNASHRQRSDALDAASESRRAMHRAYERGCTLVEIAEAAGITRQTAAKRIAAERGGTLRPKRVRA
jgi:hypothetical protein